MSNGRVRHFVVWCLSFCFAGLALTASAQSQATGQNPAPNGPVVVPPDGPVQPQPAVAPPPAPDAWDRWGIQKVSEDDDWTRHFRIGAMVGLNISANFNLKNAVTFPSQIGNYADGYVHPSRNGPYTTDWGYNNSSQYDAASHTLYMHQNTSFQSSSGTSSDSGSSAFVGFDMAYGGNLWDWGHAKIGWDLGFGWLPINIKENLSLLGNVNQNLLGFDTSRIDGIPSVPFPPAGYRGGPGGTAAIPGNPVSNVPIATPPTGSLNGTRTLDVNLYTLRLGPSVYWDLNQYLGLSASAGPAVGIVSGNLQYNETIATTAGANTYNGRISTTDVVYGGYVNASLMYHLVENGDLYVGVQYMSLGDATLSGSGRGAQLNLGGQLYISAGINWPF